MSEQETPYENLTPVGKLMADRPPAYDFGQSEIEIKFNVGQPEKPVYVRHLLKRPTLGQLEERERMSVAESINVGTGEDEIESNGVKADLALWAQVVKQLAGYRGLPGATPAVLCDVRPEWLDKIPSPHKLFAVRLLTQMECEVVNTEGDDDGFFDLGDSTVTVRQKIHGMTVTHTLRQPTEAEYSSFKPFRVSTKAVGKKSATRIQGNLKAFVEFYDKLIQGVEGATIGGQSIVISPFTLKQIDALTKRAVVQAMLDAFSVTVQD